MAEYGLWCNRRFVSTNFTNSAPVDTYFYWSRIYELAQSL
jgi:hypothetical protein